MAFWFEYGMWCTIIMVLHNILSHNHTIKIEGQNIYNIFGLLISEQMNIIGSDSNTRTCIIYIETFKVPVV